MMRIVVAGLLVLISAFAGTPAQALPAGCTANQVCVQNVRSGAIFTATLTALNDAMAAAKSGDTLDMFPALYPQGNVQIPFDVTVTCIGVAPGLAGPGDCIIDPAASWVPGTQATSNPINGLIAKGAFVVGLEATYPHVVINGVQIQNAVNSSVKLTSPAANCAGATIPPGGPRQCGGTAAGGIIVQSGELICNSCAFIHDVNGMISGPFVWGTGKNICNGCLFQYNGGNDGQEHSWYCGREADCELHDSVILDTLNGNAFKNRGYRAVVDGSTIGDSDACGITTWIGPSPVGGTPANPGDLQGGVANEINNPDAGQIVVSNNTLCKSGTYSTNAAVSDFGGVVPPWPNSSWVETNTTLKYTATNGQHLWNGSGGPASITGLTITGKGPQWAIEGLGAVSGASLNGVAWVPPSQIDWTPLEQVIGGVAPKDLRGSSGPQLVTSAGNTQAVLGGAGRLTVNVSDAGQVSAGLGGADVNVSTACVYFSDDVGDLASTLICKNEPSIGFFHADGDTLTITGTGGSFFGVASRNVTINSCDAGGIGIGSPVAPCGTVEFKGTHGYVPSGIVNLRGASDTIFCDDGCNIVMQGQDNPAGFHFSASPDRAIAPGPATVMMNLTMFISKDSVINSSQLVQANATGCSWTMGAVSWDDFSDGSCHNFFYLISAPMKSGIFLNNSTIDPGPSTNANAQGIGNLPGANNVVPAVVVGSGAFAYTPGAGPQLLEVLPASDTGVRGGYNGDIMPAHLSGGAVTVSLYNASIANLMPIVLLAGLTETSCTPTGSTNTVNISDGSTIILQHSISCGSLNIGQPPAGSSGGSLSMPGIASGSTGSVIGVSATWADTWAMGYTGEAFAKLCAAQGQVVFNGRTGPAGGCVSMAGRFEDVAPALAAAQLIVGSGPGDTVSAHVWNQGNFLVSAATAVTVTGGGGTSVGPRIIRVP